MEPLLDGHAIKDPSISALLLVPNACMLGCFNHSSISQVSEKACMQVTALCLNWLSRTCVAGLSPWAASVALQRQSLWDFLSVFLSLVSLMYYCAQGKMLEVEKREHVSFVLQF